MKSRTKILAILLLLGFVVGMTSCASNKTCSKKNKTRVPMGYM